MTGQKDTSTRPPKPKRKPRRPCFNHICHCMAPMIQKGPELGSLTPEDLEYSTNDENFKDNKKGLMKNALRRRFLHSERNLEFLKRAFVHFFKKVAFKFKSKLIFQFNTSNRTDR
jgi:hypothetical protein